MEKFNINTFVNGFNVTIKALRESERITKDSLRALSRDLLCQLHIQQDNPRCGDIVFINETLEACSPVNRRALTEFVKEFSGYQFSEETRLITNKDKGRYAAKFELAMSRLEDPHFNLWSWSERELKMEKKGFKLETLSKDIKKAMEARNMETGELLFTKADIIREVMKGGLSVDELLAVLA